MTANERIQNAAEELYDELSDADVETSVEEISELLATQREFQVPMDEAVRSARSKILDQNDTQLGGTAPETDIADIDADLGDDEWVTVRGEVLQLWDADHESIRQTGLIGDDTGRTKFTVWASSFDEKPLSEGETVELESVVTDEYQGNFSVNLNKRTTVSNVDETFEQPDDDASFSGALVAFRSGSGLIKRCPAADCTRVLNSGRCSEHGEVDGEFDLRIKGVLDDGEETQNVLFDREKTEELAGISLAEAEQLAMDALDTSVVAQDLQADLVGRYFDVSGPEFGDTLLVEAVSDQEPPTVDDLLVQGRALQADIAAD